MILVIGGAAQGKLAWALQHSGYTEKDAGTSLESSTPILTNLQNIVREALERGEDPSALIPQLLTREYVLCQEIGCGLVPIEPQERAWREAVGRLTCRLAERAGGVVRLWCGIPTWLKGGDR